jgi:hypothetical protein
MNDAWVLDYAQRMEAGHGFNMMVLWRIKDTSYGILAGNHRHGAVESLLSDADDPTITAYVVPGPYGFDHKRFETTSNPMNGNRNGENHALDTAVMLVREGDMSPRLAAAECGVTSERVSATIRADDVRCELECAKVDARKLTDTALTRISSIRAKANRLRVAEAILEANMVTSDVDALVAAVNKTTSVPKAKACVDKAIQQKQVDISTGYRSPLRKRFRKPLRALTTVLYEGCNGRPIMSVKDIGLSKTNDKEAVADLARSASDVIRSLRALFDLE